MKKIAVFCVVFSLNLIACAPKQNIMAPCPDFGKHCSKVPINSWDYK